MAIMHAAPEQHFMVLGIHFDWLVK